MNGFNFSILVKREENYTPSNLMRDYAKKHPGMIFSYSKYGQAFIEITGIRFFYDHLKIIAVSPQSEMVTVYLTDNPLVPMPGIEGDWGKKHWSED